MEPIDSMMFWKFSFEIYLHIVIVASFKFFWIGCTSRIWISFSTTSLRCSVRCRYRDFRGKFNTENSLLCFMNQLAMTFDLWHDAGNDHQRVWVHHCHKLKHMVSQWYLGRKWHLNTSFIHTKGPKVGKEYILHTITPSLPPPPQPQPWTIDSRQDESILSYCLCQIVVLLSKWHRRNWNLSAQAAFIQSSIVQFS